MPRTLIEAMAAGVPAICSDAGGAAEVASLFPSASVYDHRDPAALAALLHEACTADSLRFVPPSDAVWETFTTRHLASQYEQAYRDARNYRGLAPGDGHAAHA